MSRLYANALRTTLAAPLSDTQLTATIATGDGALFAGASVVAPFRVVLTDPDTSAREIVDITARSGDVLTIVRAVELVARDAVPTARAFPVGTTIDVVATANVYQRLEALANPDPFASVLRVARCETDYLNNQGLPFTAAQSGTGAGSTLAAAGNRPGVMRLSTGTTTTGRAAQWAIGAATDVVRFGQGVEYRMRAVLRVPTLRDGTDVFDVHVGLAQGAGTLGTPHLAFEYSTASANWRLRNSAAGLLTTLVPVVANQWTRLEWRVNADATNVEWFIDGVSVGTQASAPTTAAIIKTEIIKSAGTNARFVDLDYFGFVGIVAADR